MVVGAGADLGELAESVVAAPGVDHVVGGELAPVDRRLVVPLHTPAEMEHVGIGGGPLPALGQLAAEEVEILVDRAHRELVARQRPVQVAELLHRPHVRPVVGAGEVGIELIGSERNDRHRQDPAVFRLLVHLAPDVGDHLPLRRGRLLLALAGGPQAGAGEHAGQYQDPQRGARLSHTA
jgi:hypothetical protein